MYWKYACTNLPTHRFNQPYAAFGFTLIELLIGLALLAIMGSVALPSYQTAVRIGYRAAAKGELLRLANLQEKWRMTHASYATLAELSGTMTNGHYAFKVTQFDSNGFSISATPANANQQQDSCGIVSINQENQLSSNMPLACPQP